MRDIKVYEVQNAILILRAWSESACPDWAIGLIKSMADLIENILCQRDKGEL